jgi:hypothetical protein
LLYHGIVSSPITWREDALGLLYHGIVFSPRTWREILRLLYHGIVFSPRTLSEILGLLCHGGIVFSPRTWREILVLLNHGIVFCPRTCWKEVLRFSLVTKTWEQEHLVVRGDRGIIDKVPNVKGISIHTRGGLGGR